VFLSAYDLEKAFPMIGFPIGRDRGLSAADAVLGEIVIGAIGRADFIIVRWWSAPRFFGRGARQSQGIEAVP